MLSGSGIIREKISNTAVYEEVTTGTLRVGKEAQKEERSRRERRKARTTTLGGGTLGADWE